MISRNKIQKSNMTFAYVLRQFSSNQMEMIFHPFDFHVPLYITAMATELLYSSIYCWLFADGSQVIFLSMIEY